MRAQTHFQLALFYCVSFVCARMHDQIKFCVLTLLAVYGVYNICRWASIAMLFNVDRWSFSFFFFSWSKKMFIDFLPLLHCCLSIITISFTDLCKSIRAVAAHATTLFFVALLWFTFYAVLYFINLHSSVCLCMSVKNLWRARSMKWRR